MNRGLFKGLARLEARAPSADELSRLSSSRSLPSSGNERDLRYSLTYRDLEEIMAERNLAVDHDTIWRWVQRYAPILNQRLRREVRRPNRP
jgi:hypothetical protein